MPWISSSRLAEQRAKLDQLIEVLADTQQDVEAVGGGYRRAIDILTRETEQLREALDGQAELYATAQQGAKTLRAERDAALAQADMLRKASAATGGLAVARLGWRLTRMVKAYAGLRAEHTALERAFQQQADRLDAAMDRPASEAEANLRARANARAAGVVTAE